MLIPSQKPATLVFPHTNTYRAEVTSWRTFTCAKTCPVISLSHPNPPHLRACTTDEKGGAWELVYTDTQPFRCSPFFMALGEVFGEEKGQAETLFSLHRAATSNGEIGRVRQTISEAMLVRKTMVHMAGREIRGIWI